MTHWILTSRWHCWQYGADKSVCHKVTKFHLEEKPANDVVEVLTSEHLTQACKTCLKKTGILRRMHADAGVNSWIGFITRLLKFQRVRVAEDDVTTLAELLAEIGLPIDAVALGVWEAVRPLLLNPWRRKLDTGQTITTIPHLHDALELLPKSAKVLHQIAAAIMTWRTITGLTAFGNYKIDQVIQTMLQLPNTEAYIQHLKSRDFTHFAAVFHPNTLARAKREPALRGLFNGGGQYWESTKEQLNIVEE